MTMGSEHDLDGPPEADVPPPRRRHARARLVSILLVLVVVGGGGGAYFFWGKVFPLSAQGRAGAPGAAGGRTAPAGRPVPVVAAAARTGDIGVYLNGIGAVTPLNMVTVHTRVDGQLMTVAFREGEVVQSGSLLAEIDPRPFQAQLTQFEGQLARDQALLDDARIDRERYKVLWAQDSIPKQQLDTQEYLVRQYEGTVKNDQGQIEATKVNLIYCRIASPITGRVGLRLVDPGNIVHAADTNGLVVITQLQPITVIFTLPEDNIPSVLDKLAHGVSLVVDAYDRDDRHKLATGTLLTIDNQVDPTTGTVKLRATFPNTDNRLFPNQFVNSKLLLDVKHEAVLVPSVAIQRSPKGAFVYVIKTDRTVAVRPVTVGVTNADTVQVESGLAAGESVVVDGADRLRDGSRVELSSRSPS
jgi:multidrug efflux system membrane fusion protein